MTRQHDNDNNAAGIRYTVEPRLVPMKKAARRLHLTCGEFRDHLPALRKAGFPAACAITGHFDLKAIDAWLDKRGGVVKADEIGDDEAEQIFREALANLG